MREQKNTVKLGRGEVIFEEFMELVRQYSKQESENDRDKQQNHYIGYY